MTPEKASCRDHSQIVSLITKVAELSILPNLNREGKSYFLSRIVPDLKQVMSNDSYGIYKIQDEHNLIGFGAIRDDDYITHLFIDTRYQGTGLGKTLLRQLLKDTTGPARLRSSINAVDFYHSQGFVANGSEESVNGLRSLRMQRSR